jgi:hypothetical protein
VELLLLVYYVLLWDGIPSLQGILVLILAVKRHHLVRVVSRVWVTLLLLVLEELLFLLGEVGEVGFRARKN